MNLPVCFKLSYCGPINWVCLMPQVLFCWAYLLWIEWHMGAELWIPQILEVGFGVLFLGLFLLLSFASFCWDDLVSELLPSGFYVGRPVIQSLSRQRLVDKSPLWGCSLLFFFWVFVDFIKKNKKKKKKIHFCQLIFYFSFDFHCGELLIDLLYVFN